MANRTFNPGAVQTLVKKVVTLFPVVSFGALGAPTLQRRIYANGTSSLAAAPTTGVGYVVGDGAGTRGIVRTGTGRYTMTLSDSYQYLIGVEVIQIVAAVTPGGTLCAVKSAATNVATNNGPGNGGVIDIQMYSPSSPGWTSVNPASGDVYTFCIRLGDATEP